MSDKKSETKWLSNDFKTFVRTNKNGKKQLLIIIPTSEGDLAISLYENYIKSAFMNHDKKEVA